MKHALIWLTALVALSEAGWMTFDGARGLIVGDYVRPSKGPHAGQLGPWSKLVSAVGIDPESSLMKSIFVVYGVLWLAIVACFLFRVPWAWTAMLLAAVGSLWYLTIGTAHSVVLIVLLLLPPVRAAFAGSASPTLRGAPSVVAPSPLRDDGQEVVDVDRPPGRRRCRQSRTRPSQ